MKYDITITYNDGTISIKVGDNEMFNLKDDLMTILNGWAFLGFTGSQNDNIKDLNVAFSSICETELTSIVSFWQVGDKFVTGPQRFAANSSQKLIVGFLDSTGTKNIPHFSGQNIMDLQLRIGGTAMTISNVTVQDDYYLAYNIQVPRTVGDYNVTIEIIGRTGVNQVPLSIFPSSFDRFDVKKVFNDVYSTSPIALNGPDLYLTQVYSWDFLKNKQYLLLVETQDQFGNFFDM
jgi:hypothetical protein